MGVEAKILAPIFVHSICWTRSPDEGLAIMVKQLWQHEKSFFLCLGRCGKNNGNSGANVLPT